MTAVPQGKRRGRTGLPPGRRGRDEGLLLCEDDEREVDHRGQATETEQDLPDAEEDPQGYGHDRGFDDGSDGLHPERLVRLGRLDEEQQDRETHATEQQHGEPPCRNV